jgi:hypothetical protein
MPNYLVTIYRDEEAFTQATGAEVSAPYREFMQRRSGSLRGGAALEPGVDGHVGACRRVRRVQCDRWAVRREQGGAGWLLRDRGRRILDEALSIAKEVPAPFGGVEVRPIRVLS